MPDNGRPEAGFIPAGKKAATFFKGPYGAIAPAYHALGEYLEQAGFHASGVAYDFYYNSLDEVPESELLTRIMFLLK